MSKSEHKTIVAAVVLGALAGAGVSLALGGRSSGGVEATHTAEAAQPREVARAPSDVVALERRLRSVESELHDRAADAQTAAHAAAADVPLLSPEAEEAAEQRRWSDALASFTREPLDASWARSTHASLRADMTRQLSAKGSIKSLECRSASCRGVVSLSGSDQEVQANALALVHADYGAACAVRIYVPPHDARPGSGVEADILFRCEPEA
jgi:hypothetical protein